MKKLELNGLMLDEDNMLISEEKRTATGGRCHYICYCLNGFEVYVPCGDVVSCAEQCGE